MNNLPDEFTPRQVAALYLESQNVTIIVVAETKDIAGEFELSKYGGTYLADNLVFLQHVEFNGEMRKVIGVLKKRMSDFERTLREFEITQHGVQVGDPITNLRGVITGTPELVSGETDTQLTTTD